MQDNISDFFRGGLHVFIGNLSTYVESAHQKELIREFSLILGTKIGYCQNLEGQNFISTILRDRLEQILSR